MFFAQGEMVGKTPLTNEWVQMTNAVKGGGRSLENYSIPIAMANRTPPPSPLVNPKEDEHDDEDQDGSGRGKGKGRKKIKKGRTKDKTDVGNDTWGGGNVTMDINPIIKAKIMPVLPDFLTLKNCVVISNREICLAQLSAHLLHSKVFAPIGSAAVAMMARR